MIYFYLLVICVNKMYSTDVMMYLHFKINSKDIWFKSVQLK